MHACLNAICMFLHACMCEGKRHDTPNNVFFFTWHVIFTQRFILWLSIISLRLHACAHACHPSFLCAHKYIALSGILNFGLQFLTSKAPKKITLRDTTIVSMPNENRFEKECFISSFLSSILLGKRKKNNFLSSRRKID